MSSLAPTAASLTSKWDSHVSPAGLQSHTLTSICRWRTLASLQLNCFNCPLQGALLQTAILSDSWGPYLISCHPGLKPHNPFDSACMSYVQTATTKSFWFFIFTRLFSYVFLYSCCSDYCETHDRFTMNIHKPELGKFLQQNYRLGGSLSSLSQ